MYLGKSIECWIYYTFVAAKSECSITELQETAAAVARRLLGLASSKQYLIKAQYHRFVMSFPRSLCGILNIRPLH